MGGSFFQTSLILLLITGKAYHNNLIVIVAVDNPPKKKHDNIVTNRLPLLSHFSKAYCPLTFQPRCLSLATAEFRN